MSRGDGSPVTFFQELYAIVVGLGLALAVEQVIDLDRSGFPVTAEHLPLFLAYLNIGFALAHASVRYLQLAYVDGDLGPLGRPRVIGDLVLGVGHFLWLMTLSFVLTRPREFVYVAIVLLIGRPARDGFLMLGRRPRLEFDKKVAAIHLVTIGAFLGTIAVAAFSTGDAELWTLRIGGLAASLLFGLGMYTLAFPYFFPAGDVVEAPAP
jgi:hypothetical protein